MPTTKPSITTQYRRIKTCLIVIGAHITVWPKSRSIKSCAGNHHTPVSGHDPFLPFASGSYAVFDPRVLDSIDNLPTTVTTFSGAFQRDIAVA
jgi:hypothetical protein